jgi:hypothetical protein
MTGAIREPIHAHKRPQRTEVPPRMSLVLKTIVIGHRSRAIQPMEIKIIVCFYRLENSIKLMRGRLVAMYESYFFGKIIPIVAYKPQIRGKLTPLVRQRVNI